MVQFEPFFFRKKGEKFDSEQAHIQMNGSYVEHVRAFKDSGSFKSDEDPSVNDQEIHGDRSPIPMRKSAIGSGLQLANSME